MQASAEGVPASEHWPLPPQVLEQRLAHDPFEILSARTGVGGVSGVKKLKIRFANDGQELAVKWKRSPRGDADGWNNTPRKEMAAYHVQRWFLEAEDYVVPTVVVRCLDEETHAATGERFAPTLPDTHCVIGALTVWLENVTVPDDLYDEDTFRTDRVYARHLADLNVLAYLIDHEDGREGNWLVSELPGQRRVFSIDNGVAFGSRVTNWFVRNWNRIRVPSLPTETIERLRAVGPDDLRALGVVAELRADPAGVLRSVSPGPNLDPDDGARTGPGRIQLGLDDDEIEDVAERLVSLIEQVDAGLIETF